MAFTNVPSAVPELAASPEMAAKVPVIQATRANMANLVDSISKNPGVSAAKDTALGLLGAGLVGMVMLKGIRIMATGKAPDFLSKNS